MSEEFKSAGYYKVFRFGECMGAAYGTPTGVSEWATGKWGRFISIEPCSEEEAARINRH